MSLEVLLILGAIYLVYRLFLNWYRNNKPPEDPKVEPNGWEPLLPESKYNPRPYDPFTEVPYVCPRCHHLNSPLQENFDKQKAFELTPISTVHWTHYIQCEYCGYEFTFKTHSGRNPRW